MQRLQFDLLPLQSDMHHDLASVINLGMVFVSLRNWSYMIAVICDTSFV
jgi:hypothetical protein